MLARLLAHRRGRKMPEDGRVRRPAVKHVKKEKEKDVVERNVRALKRSGKVGDEEKEVRKRVGSPLGGALFFLSFWFEQWLMDGCIDSADAG